MGATLTKPPSQTAFERDLREHMASHTEGGPAAPGVNGVRQGIDVATLDELRERLGLSQEDLERTLHVSTRTLQRRRRGDQRLSAAESDRLWRLLHVTHRALEAFDGDEEAARAWLTSPKPLLGGETPLERLDTEPGLREVEEMLTVIDETSAA